MVRGSRWHLMTSICSHWVCLSVTDVSVYPREGNSEKRDKGSETGIALWYYFAAGQLEKVKDKNCGLIWRCRDLVRSFFFFLAFGETWLMVSTKWHPCLLNPDSLIYYFESRHGKTVPSKWMKCLWYVLRPFEPTYKTSISVG